MTGTDGYFTASYRYNAYGEMTFGKPQYENVYGYNGESYNPNLDGQYLRARYYHVEAANFFTEDSYLGDIREPLSLNRYNYVYSSYLNYIDPSGHRLDDDALTYRQFTNELNRVQNSRSYQKTLITLGKGFSYIAKKVAQAQGKAVALTCDLSKSAKDAIDRVNWSRVSQGTVQTLLAASLVAVGITAIVATGGLAGAAVAGLAAGSGISAAGATAIGTFIAGSTVTVMGTADILESGTDIFYGFNGNSEESIHLIRDNIQYFRDNPDEYYLLEGLLGGGAAIGTDALKPFIQPKSVPFDSKSKNEQKWVDEQGNIIWPTNRGFAEEPTTITLQPGTRVDRYGYDGGTFVSPEGTPFSQRSLAPGTENKPYTVFEVVKEVEVQSGRIAPWFGEEGNGIQYEFSAPISKLLEQGILKKVEK